MVNVLCICVYDHYLQATINAYKEQDMIKRDSGTLRVCYNEDIEFDVHPTKEAISGCIVTPKQNKVHFVM